VLNRVCPEERYGDHARKLGDFGTRLIHHTCTLVSNKEDYKTFMTIIRAKGWYRPLSWDLLVRNQESLTLEDVVHVGKIHSEYPSGNEDFFNETISRLHKNVRYTLCTKVTEEFVQRMTEDEKIEFFKLKIKKEESIAFDNSVIAKHYLAVSYAKFRPLIKENPEYLVPSAEIIIHNDDKELAEVTLKHTTVSPPTCECLFKMISTESKMEVIKKDISRYGTYYHHYIKDSFTKREYPTLLETVLKTHKKEGWNYVKALFELVVTNKGNVAALNQVIKDNDLTPGIIPVDKIVYKHLDNDCKVKMILTGIKDNSDTDSYYRQYNDSSNDTYEYLFKTMSRSDLEQAYQGHFLYSPYVRYMAHAMTPEEIHCVADRDENFRQHNVTLLGYPYFRKYENSMGQLKKMVGDRRKPHNRNFFNAILKIFKEASPSMRFILDLEEEAKNEGDEV